MKVKAYPEYAQALNLHETYHVRYEGINHYGLENINGFKFMMSKGFFYTIDEPMFKLPKELFEID